MKKLRTATLLAVALVALIAGGSWIYINIIEGEPAAELTLADLDAATTDVQSTTSSTETSSPETSAPSKDLGNAISGTWAATANSEVGYRVQKVMFGQDAESVGRTNDLTGSMTVSGTTIEDATFEVQMGSLTSDSAERDGQVRGRLLETATYPTSTFVLTAPIELATEPEIGEEIAVSATGDLTIKGETKSVDLEFTARRNDTSITALAQFMVVFDQWGIENPSVGPIQVEGTGLLEIGLAFEKS